MKRGVGMALVAVVVALAWPRAAGAQGCVLGRNSAIGLGAQATPYLDAGQSLVTADYRYQDSQRSFVGTRVEAGSAVRNTVHLVSVALTWAPHARLTLTLRLPYIVGERSQPVADLGAAGGSYRTTARGLGDVTLLARLWLLDPRRFHRGNLAVGLGLKVPTGQDNASDTVPAGSGSNVAAVDAAIQPGDGGWGFLVQLDAFARLWRFSPYLSALYLFNPRNTNGVASGLGLSGELVLSVADSYLASAGTYVALPGLPPPHGLALKAGVRAEGVPPRDALGGSDGFRRPGVALSVEPGLSYTYARWAFELSVPVAVYRNRQPSVADERYQRRGDATFADYLILATLSRAFGGH